MTKYTTINGVEFETYKSKYTQGLIDNHKTKTLWQCYEKPSKIKESIYYDWLEWFEQTDNVYEFGITSSCWNNFTLGGIVFDKETGEDIGYIRITKCHNRLYLFKN